MGQGYYGLNIPFAVNVGLAFGVNILTGGNADNPNVLVVWLVAVVVLFLVITLLCFPFNKKLAFGLGWQSGSAIIASVLIGLNSAFCCGVIGYIVMQAFATNEMKKYGIKTGLFSLRKKVIAAKVEEMRQRR